MKLERYLIVIIPIIMTHFYVDSKLETSFIFWSLLFISLISLLDRLKNTFHIAILLVELIYIFGLTFYYQGILYLLFISFLLKWHSSKNSGTHIVIFGLLLMNISLLHHEKLHLCLANLLFILLYLVLKKNQTAIHTKDETEYLYDELRKKHYELEDARQRLLQYAKQVEHSAQIEERHRIAADIHDDLGHKLTRIKFMFDACLSIEQSNPAKYKSMLLEIRNQLSDTIESLRSIVHNMRPSTKPFSITSLKKLLEETQQKSGVNVQFSVSGSAYGLSPSEEHILFRNTQEAITNALRHGKATDLWVELEYKPFQITLIVKNNGKIPGSVKMGFGLRGMEERALLVGGSITVEINEEFTVRTILPRNIESSVENE